MVTRPIVSLPVQHISSKMHSCEMMRAVLTHPLFTVKSQYVQSFFKTLECCNLKETNTSFLCWLASLFLPLKSVIFARKNGSETCNIRAKRFPATRANEESHTLNSSKTQSQSKLLGHFCVCLSLQCWCTWFGDWTAINNFQRAKGSTRREKPGFGLSVPTIFVGDCSSVTQDVVCMAVVNCLRFTVAR